MDCTNSNAPVVKVEGDIDPALQERYVSLLARGLGDSLPPKSTVCFHKMVGFSNEVYKVVVKSAVSRIATKEETLTSSEPQESMFILKKKPKESPHHQFLKGFLKIKQFLVKHKFGPAVLYEDADILIEDFIPSETCTAEEFRDPAILLPSVFQLAQFSRNFMQNLSDYGTPDEYSTLLDRIIEEGAIEKCLEILRALRARNPDYFPIPDSYVEKIQAFFNFEFELRHLCKDIGSLKHTMCIVCHNDFYWLNVLRRTDLKGFMLIDYEYAGWNPIGWDLANYYLERNFVYEEATNQMVFKSNMPTNHDIASTVHFYLLALRGKIDSSQATDSSILTQIASGKFARAMDLEFLEQYARPSYFFRLMLAINSMWIIFLTLHLKEDPGWPVHDYLLMRIDTQSEIRKLLRSNTCDTENTLGLYECSLDNCELLV